MRTESQVVPHVKPGLPRTVELPLAIFALVITSPFIALAALAIVLSSGGPVFFLQERLGANAMMFRLIKLRTMRRSNGGPNFTAGDDNRVTSVGRFLRATKLDELPQLWNVIRGDMALVGPRPEVPRYVDPTNALWRTVLQAKPGIADPTTILLRNEDELLAQLNGNRDQFYIEVLQPYKLKGYYEYLSRRNWRTDLGVIANTAIAVLLPNRFPPPTLEEIANSQESRLSRIPKASAINGQSSKKHSRFRSSRLLILQIQYALDILTLSGSFVLAYLLRFEFSIPAEESKNLIIQLPCIVLIQFVVLIITGVYSFVWRYVGMTEVRTFLKAALLACLPVVLTRLTLPTGLKPLQVPLSIALMDNLFAFAGILGLRVLRRAIYESARKNHGLAASEVEKKKRVLLIGAGRAGLIAAKEILSAGSSNLDIKGFVDDNPKKRGLLIQAIKVLGNTADLPRLVRQYQIDHVVISIGQATRHEFRRILDICEQVPVRVRVMPGLHEILQGKVKVSRIRDLQIEDLLGRQEVQLNEQEIKQFLAGKSVLVSGAGGSIGSELCRQIARFQPANLLMVDRAEFALFDIDRELNHDFPKLSKVPLIADISDRERIKSILATYHPDVVVHAAAHKHVPMMECNANEAIKNNVLGTSLLGELAGQYGVDVFVMVSTDKAVRPTSIMGATKRIAELVCQHLDRKYDTRYVAVRFGNVIGSAGSVIPIFRQQIMRGGPVTVTHPEMTRYFMTIPEASQLVLQAGTMGRGGEIFILDMGDPVKILDLANDAVSLSGLKPNEDIEIVFTGVRPGEKLFEELEIKEEKISKTSHPKIFIGKIAAYPSSEIVWALDRLNRLSHSDDEVALRNFLNSLLPEARLHVASKQKSEIAQTADALQVG